MNWKLPNQLTVGRLLLGGVFFVLLGLFEQGTDTGVWLLNVALGVYILAGLTDVLDGWIARRYQLTSAFGRIVDPFVDKVLVVGAFAMLAGSNFAMGSPEALSDTYELSLPVWLTGRMASGVQAWMVVTIVAREFIVSAVRGYSESQGIKFPATIWGKLKMFTQSVAICMVLLQLGNLPRSKAAVIIKLVAVWLSVIVTVLSGLAYVRKSRSLMARGEGPG